MTTFSPLFPLGTSQRDILFDQILHPDLPLYNIGGYAKIDGCIDHERFELAVNLLVKKHDALRLVIAEANDENGLPQQSFLPQLSVTVPFIDFSEQLDAKVQALAWMQQRVVEPFELYGQPLFRYELLKVSSSEFYWFGQFHHLITDGWSIALLTRSLADIYTSLCHGNEPELSVFSYLEHLKKENDYIHSSQYQRDRDYWQQQYQTTPPALLSPYYRNHFTGKVASGKCHTFYLPRAIYNQLNVLASELKVSSFHLILGILYTYFIRTSQQSNLIIGLPILNRSNAHFRKTAGLFVGISPLNFDFGTELSFTSLVKSISKVLKRAYRHQRFPVSEINHIAGLSEQMSRSQLFDLSVSYEKQNHDANFGDSSARTISLSNQSEQTPLTVFVREWNEAEDVQVDFSYNLSYFNQQDIEGISARFNHILEYVLIEPNKLVADIPLLPIAEVQQLNAWNDTQADYPADKCIHELFEQQVKENSDAIALVFEDQQLTYGELNQQANQLAHYLIKEKGIKPDTLVGICLERSLEMVVAILGILKAGGAYVPLDLDYPEARLTYMLADAALEVVITTDDVLTRTPTTLVQALCLDNVQVRQQLSSQSIENLLPNFLGLTANHLAYVIYTSGSTGKPKGVLQTHKTINNLMCSQTDFGAGEEVSILQYASMSFDVSVQELATAWKNSAKYIMTSIDEKSDFTAIINKLIEHKISVLFMPPAALSGLAAMYESNPKKLPNLSTIISAGEQLNISRSIRCMLEENNITLVNHYGPTETHVVTENTNCLFSSNTPVSIGKPINNTKLYVVDACNVSQPIGVKGELLIGGAGLAQGYLNRPELTAEKFIQNPFNKNLDERLYKTGDVVRWLANGELEFISRIDEQVNIRGFRIELEEIENTLLAHVSIIETVVVAREDKSGDKRLVAYLVSCIHTSATAEAIDDWRQHLNQTLPEYMVPSIFVVLDALPLTPNGKVDRKALPAPDMSQLQDVYIAPTTATEQLLCDIWQDILGFEQVGVTDNFFRLGGHSLLATRVVSQVNLRLNIMLQLKSLFEANTVHTLAMVVDKLDLGSVYPTIKEVSRTEPLLLSYAQQRLWFIDKLEPGGSQYNMPTALNLSGSLNTAALQRAFSSIVERHESLRTLFVDDGDAPLQVIQRAVDVDFPIVDLSHLDEIIQAAQITKYTNDEAGKPFDLSRDPMLRAKLLKVAEDRHVLLATMHHIASDGWSTGILIKELSTLYQAYVENKENPLPPLPIQYADYAHWQRNWLQGEVLAKQLDYWQGQLSELPVVHSLPLDHIRPPQQTFRGGSVTVILSQSSLDSLKALCEREGATLFMGLHAAFSVLLARYSNETDIVIGSPIANREQAEVAELIGFFVNTLVLRSDVSGNPSFIDMLQQSKQAALDAYAHQQVPFEQLVEVLQPERSLSHSPLFQIMLVLQNNEQSALALSGLTLTQIAQTDVQAKFDLTLSVTETGQGLALDWNYNTDLFEANSIERMAEHFTRLLESLVNEPNDNVHSLELLSEVERHQQLVEWNDTAADYPKDKCIHELFEQQVQISPDAIAVIYENSQLTYKELNQKANQLAHYLIEERQVTPDTLVGICVDRSLEMIVGIMGILKAGGAYVPLDPSYPEARLAYMLEDANLTTVLTQTRLKGETPVSESQAVYLDSEQMIIQLQNYQDSNSVIKALTSSHLAYVIYTSGSTGKPKGVMVEHSSVNNYLLFSVEHYCQQITGSIVSTSLNFDATLTSVFSPLVCGKFVQLIPSGVMELDGLINVILQACHPLLFKVTPAHLDVMASSMQNVLNNTLVHTFVIGGEELKLKTLSHWKKKLLPNAVFVNEFGPTETTVGCSVYKNTSSEDIAHLINSVPIGKPIINTQLYIFNDSVLCPRGVTGELCIGGAGLARGYLNQSELTEEKFILNPFYDATNPNSNERLYKTGDLVRYLPDGNLEFLGRIDDQVKIRGFRIELGEIENTLLTHESIKEAVVVAREEESGDKRLVAYLVSDTRATTIDDWRQHLNQTLPEYMVPSVFVVLDTLPLTPNGKVDRKALPVPDMSELQDVYVAPSTVTEKVLCDIWQDVLGLEQVGITDNFFRLGGHSLLATRVVSQVNQQLNITLTLKLLFEANTVQTLAIAVGQLDLGSVCPTIKEVSRTEPLLLSYAQQRLWLLDKIDGGSAHYNMPSALRLTGDLNVDALKGALSTIIERHESLRTFFIEDNDGQPLQVIRPASAIEVLMTDISLLPAGERDFDLAELVVAEASKPFDLSNKLSSDLMLRAQLVKVEEQAHILLVTMHHITSDGWSIGILINEFSVLYQAYVQGEENPLPELAIQYADYAQWQRDWLQGEVLDAQLGYWKTQLAALPVVHSLPLDKTRPKTQTFNGAAHHSLITSSATDKLNTLCKGAGGTLFMGLHAAFSVLLARYSNETDIVVGSPIANREQAEVASLIGFFVNTLVLRSDVSGKPSFIELLQQSKQTDLDAYAHQQVPFEQLVEVLQPERSLSHSPLFQVMLALQNNEQSSLSLPGLTLSPVPQDHIQAKFDLMLNAVETDQGLALTWEYNTDLFEGSTIERMAAHFVGLIGGLLTSPNEDVNVIEFLSESERHQLLVQWNDTQSNYPADKCIHELFEAQVNNTPDAIALVFENKQLTYQELNEKSNQLAHYLIAEKGVKPDTLVGICLERSLEMVIAILGTLKAGGAYVPLDPDYPEARLVYMLEDSGLDTVITTSDVLVRTPISVIQAICLDEDKLQAKLRGKSLNNIIAAQLTLTSRNLAYVIYTSGSTGNPKGVMVEHYSVVRLVKNTNFIDYEEVSAIAQASNVSFDAATFEIWGALLNGARLVYVAKHELLNTALLEKKIEQHGIDTLFITTALFNNMAEMSPHSFSKLNNVFFGGEQSSIHSVRTILNEGNVKRLVHVYGPTESTTFSTWKELALDYVNSTESLAIGEPLSNTTAYVVNKNLQLQPVGASGELLLGGDGLSRGYLNRPELTAEKFIPNPFSDAPNERLYKTGDLVRWLPDGNLEFIGRIDEQVKIRGFRIELGEIENSLLTHAMIKDSVVVALEEGGDKRLVAYVVTSQSTANDELLVNAQVDILRQHLSHVLPDYMVPSAFVVLDALPLTPNGKVDKKALPAPDMTQLQDVYVAPSTDTEKVLCEIWQDILGLEQVGVTDNFFHLGGHSLLAVRMVAQLGSSLGAEVSVRSVFAYPSVKTLAIFIDEEGGQGTSVLPAIIPRQVDEVIPLALIQQSYWFLYQLEESGTLYNTPLTLRFSGKLNILALEQALRTLVCRHENLRTRIIETHSGPQQVVELLSSWSLPVVRTNATDVAALVEEHARKAFVLHNEAAFRGALFCIDTEVHVLNLVSHHAFMDGWSMDIMFRELSQLYDAFCSGNENPLPPLSIQYGDYAVWQQGHIKGERYEQQCAYWQEKLQGLPPLLNLPTDHIRPAVQSYRGDSCPVAIPLALSEQLSAYAQVQGVTLYHVLLGGLTVLLSRYARTSDIPIGTAIANRPQQVLEELIGCFANTVVLRCDAQRERDFNTIVKGIRDTVLDAFAHADVPFDGVVEAVKPERSLGVPPIFQVMFRLHNQARGEGVALQGLELTPFNDLAKSTVELDLNISLVETSEGIQGEFAYATDLFNKTTIERFIAHYCQVLTEAMKAPSEPIASLALLSPQEQQQLTHWNDTRVDYPQDEGIQTLFEGWVVRSPEKIAYVCGDKQYSYQALNEQVNQLAHWLRSQGVGSEVRVGVCVGRTAWMGISLLAILKAGGTYVPLDPAYPKARLAHMVEVATPSLILTEQAQTSYLPKTKARTVCCDVEGHLWAAAPTDNLIPLCKGEHSAYILFTSGTTGKPKGILVAHKSLRNMAVAHQEWQLLNEQARILQFASLSFSISIWGSFMAWAGGATLYQVTDEEALPGKPLYQLLNNAQISTVTWPVSLLSTLPMSDMPQSLTTIISSAEPCTDAVVARWVKHGCRFLNMYGNSEVAIGSTLYEYHDSEQKLSIGRALPNTQVYLLDEQLQPVPVGVVAEIYTAGVGLAKGYVDNEEETKKQFIVNPFNADAGSRLYKTGDLGRYLPNGDIEFIGREDFQVSIRGFRIELAEIESVLRAHKTLSEIAVVACPDRQGTDHLVCFYVLDNTDVHVTVKVLRKAVSEQLPSYMIPSLFIALEAMPLTPNRKIDRFELPIPDFSAFGQEEYVAAKTDTEKVLCEIWKDVLDLEKVGITDNFFHIGGHSLLATKLLLKINELMGIDLKIRDVFTCGNIMQMAKLINDYLIANQKEQLKQETVDDMEISW